MGWIHAVIDVPEELLQSASSFWEDSLGWPLGPTWPGHPELCSFEPPAGDAYVHLQHIGEAPRVHLDLEVDDLSGARDRWAGLGATVTGPVPQPGKTSWQALRSPGGLPFCLVPARQHHPPAPVSWPTGHRSRLVQVCIDLPADRADAEVEFWRAGLGWRWAGSNSREFVGKMHDDHGSPLQLLFQRLGEASGSVRAHLDLGTDNMDREVDRQLAFGATDPVTGRGFVALRDPAGLAYCVTGNSPEATESRDIG